MKKYSALSALTLLTIVWMPSLPAYILEASLWRSWHTPSQRYQYVLVCHDVHNYSEALNNAQIEAFKAIIPQCHELTLILENQPVSAQEYRERNLHNTGAELHELCMHRNFPLVEIDYRKKRSRSYYKCMTTLSSTNSPHLDAVEKQLLELGCTTKALAQEFEDAAAQTHDSLIRLQEQGTLSWYSTQAFLNLLIVIRNQWKDALSAWKSFEGTLLAYCQQNQCLTSEYLTQSLTFDTSLVDIRLFLQTLEASSLVTIVYAGGIHCMMVEEYLQRYSPFKRIASKGISVDLTREYVQVPPHIPPEKIAGFTMTADKLFTIKERELIPLDASFLSSIAKPEAFIKTLPWWKQISCFLSALW